MAAFNPVQAVSISQCPVCCHEYHPEECIPRLLRSCGHTFCETCLAGLQKSAPSPSVVRCPSCRVETAVEAGKRVSESFPKNYALLENIENVKAAATREVAALITKECEICSERQALFGCIECETKYCEGCWGFYHKARAHRSHKKVSPGDALEIKCPNHPSKTVELVCLEPSCPAVSRLICLLCKNTAAHKGHLIETIEQVAANKRKQLIVAIRKANKNLRNANSVMIKVQETYMLLNGASLADRGADKGFSSVGAADEVPSTHEQALVFIDTTFRQLMTALEQRRTALIEEVGILVKTKSEKLKEQYTELYTFLSRSNTCVQDASLFCLTNDRPFMASFRAHHDLLTETIETELFPKPVVTPLVDLAFSHDLLSTLAAAGILHNVPVLQYRTSSAGFSETFSHKFGSSGQGDGQFNLPYGLAFSPDGHLFVSDFLNHRIQVFLADGTFVCKFGSFGQGDGQFHNPIGFVFSPDGHLFVSDASNHRIQVFRADGTFVRKFGSKGQGDGQFKRPTGVTFNPEGHLFVADFKNNRIQVFT